MDKRSSLLRKFVNYEQKKFYNIDTRSAIPEDGENFSVDFDVKVDSVVVDFHVVQKSDAVHSVISETDVAKSVEPLTDVVGGISSNDHRLVRIFFVANFCVHPS